MGLEQNVTVPKQMENNHYVNLRLGYVLAINVLKILTFLRHYILIR